MTITAADVRHLAKLASLDPDPAALDGIAAQLDTIVDYVRQLQSVDTTGIEPAVDMSGMVGVTRPDVPGPLLDRTQILANAPARTDAAFLVPKVVER